jgi:protein-tyrosine phosphatase
VNFFKKSKPILKDLIPSNYIDIHSHLLPGIDDGAQNTADTKMLYAKMKEMGFAKCITTPHIISGIWENTRESITTTLEATVPELPEENRFFTAAAEYMMDSEFSNLFKTEKLLTLKDNFVLVEMSYINPPIQLYEILFDLRIAGYQPVLAHPERYLFYHKSFNEYQKLINAGCLLQLNLLSTVGYYGKEVAKIAETLLQKKMYSFTGSDIHHLKHIESFSSKIIISETKELETILENNQTFDF